MKLPYSNNHYVYLETMDDVEVFDKYISDALGNNIYRPLEFYRESNDRLPNYAYLACFAKYYSWGDSNLPHPHRTFIPLDALFNCEKYPEYLI